MVRASSSFVQLVTAVGEPHSVPVVFSAKRMQSWMDAKAKIERVAEFQFAHFLVRHEPVPDAFAIEFNGRPALLVNTGLIDLVGDDTDAIAFVIGHHLVHWTQGTQMSVRPGMARSAATSVSDADRLAFELHADVEAIRYAHAAGFQPDGGLRLLKLLAEWQSAERIYPVPPQPTKNFSGS